MSLVWLRDIWISLGMSPECFQFLGKRPGNVGDAPMSQGTSPAVPCPLGVGKMLAMCL
jgi:hypothetical protein